MPVKLKYEESGLIRSVGDAPNGVLAMTHTRGEPEWIVHPTVQTDHLPTEKDTVTVAEMTGDPFEGGAVVLTPEEIAEACADTETAQMVYTLAVTHFALGVNGAVNSYDWEYVIAGAEFCKSVRDQMAVAGFLQPPPE